MSVMQLPTIIYRPRIGHIQSGKSTVAFSPTIVPVAEAASPVTGQYETRVLRYAWLNFSLEVQYLQSYRNVDFIPKVILSYHLEDSELKRIPIVVYYKGDKHNLIQVGTETFIRI